MTKLNYSIYQKKIFENIATGSGHTIVNALAGSGKTSTAIESFKYLPRGKKTLMVAFNRSIAKELKDRAPSYVDCSTLHSLGFSAVKNSFGTEIVIDSKKCDKIVEENLSMIKSIPIKSIKYDLIQSITRCISLCKATLSSTKEDIISIIEEFDVETFDLTNEFYNIVIKSMDDCKKDTLNVDFDDMIWFPYVFKLKLKLYDYVYCDEAQDFNKAQMYLVLSSCAKTGRIIALGDKFQAIYGFRAADSAAMDLFKNKLNAQEFDLPITYRCPKKVVYMAQNFVPKITAKPDAKDGEILYISESNLLDNVKPGDFIISRTNAPLVKHCLILLKEGIRANIKGRDMGQSFLFFIKKSKAKTIKSFIKYIDKWKDSEIKRLTALNKNTQYCLDKALCLTYLCENDQVKSIDDLTNSIKELFDDDDDSKRITLSTVHKIKGLEADNVFILKSTFRIGDFNKHHYDEMNEEKNLAYVAITRSKDKLYIVNK